MAQQLLRVVASQGGQRRAAGGVGGAPLLAAAAEKLPPQLPTEPPAPKVAVRLRRALAAGWADQVPSIVRLGNNCHFARVVHELGNPQEQTMQVPRGCEVSTTVPPKGRWGTNVM